ncbi:MAG: hypothetical protein AAFP00_01010 [Bacteroidota bacterium]
MGRSKIRSHTTLPRNLIRFYIGLEDADMLIEDLAQALEKISVGAVRN